MNKNSIAAYKLILLSLTNKQRIVYQTIRQLKKATMHKVADQMGVQLNTISGRFSELRKQGLIKTDEDDTSGTCKKAIWSIV